MELGDLSQIDESPRGTPPKKKKRGPLLLKIVATLLALAVVGALSLVITFIVLSRDLPEIRSLNDYRPKQATVVFGKDGQVVARFASERRTVVPLDRIPQVVIDAVVAAEDADFFDHQGIDSVAILRCAVKNVISGRAVCGGSTITQQTVKTFFLTPEKSLGRKLRELILTKRVEEALSKRDILYLYLNQIYYGHRAYGIQEAARVYFSKNVEDLTIEEAALLVGIPQSPARLDPYRYPERAAKRRSYVLGRMLEGGKIDRAAYDKAMSIPIRVDWRVAEGDLDNATHYAAHVRKELEGIVGAELAQDGGLKVYVGIDPALQRQAENAIREGVRALDKRQGWRGPLAHLEPDELTAVRSQLAARLSTAAPSIGELEGSNAPRFQPVIWDLSKIDARKRDNRLNLEALVFQARFRRLEAERIVGGLVTSIDDPGKAALVELAPGVEVKLPLRTGLGWARKFDLARMTAAPKAVGDVLKKGDVVLVRVTSITPPDPAKNRPTPEILGVLEQAPLAQAAMMAIEPATRQVRALVGGYGSGAGTFNRVTQAKRQAGSTFKPFVYGAALQSGKYTTVSKCMDRPHVDRDEWTGKAWKPKNYDGHFDGEITLRTALTKSKNLCSIDIVLAIGQSPVLDLAEQAGITAYATESGPAPEDEPNTQKKRPLIEGDSVALGALAVKPLELINSYATIAAGGRLAQPIFIQKVVDPNGKILFESKEELMQTITPELAYQITSLMQSVVEDGTAKAVLELDQKHGGKLRVGALSEGKTVRPSWLAGKTGTTNDSRDAWFIGFTADMVAGVWVGFDNNDPLGPGETGGRSAIPIWIDFMDAALKNMEPREFVVPQGIVLAHVDPESGLLAPPDHQGAALEPFVAGTEPTDFLTSAKTPENFGLDDYDTP